MQDNKDINQDTRERNATCIVNDLIRKKGRTNGRDCCHDLTKLELVQNGSLTSRIETHHQDTHLFLGKEPAEKFGEC